VQFDANEPEVQLQPAPVHVIEEQLRFWHWRLHVAPDSQVTVGRRSLLFATMLQVDPASQMAVTPEQLALFSQLRLQVCPDLQRMGWVVLQMPPFLQSRLHRAPSSHVRLRQSEPPFSQL
jgi:hypothetical protein